jgi:predicted nucleotidyltransferase
MEVRSVEAIVRALNEAGVQYLIVGGLAVNAHGFVRFTRDVDIVLGLEPANAERGLNTLLNAGWRLAIPETPAAFANPATRARWRTERNMIVLKLWSDEHRRTPIDVFIYEPFDFAKELTRAVRMEMVPGVLAPVVSLETLLRMKREAGRAQDLEDIKELNRAR